MCGDVGGLLYLGGFFFYRVGVCVVALVVVECTGFFLMRDVREIKWFGDLVVCWICDSAFCQADVS